MKRGMMRTGLASGTRERGKSKKLTFGFWPLGVSNAMELIPRHPSGLPEVLCKPKSMSRPILARSC